MKREILDLLIPKRFALRRPLRCSFRLGSAELAVSGLSTFLHIHHASIVEYLNMLRHSRLAHNERFSQRGECDFAICEPPEDRSAGLVAESLGGLV